jgi:hypothetical protein
VKLNRRSFLLFLLAPAQVTTSLQVAVLETFIIGNSACAVVVHHADPASRDAFGDWMRSHSKSAVRVRTQEGNEENAIVFRVRTCFGRGLILLDRPMQIHERDVLTILM